MTWQMRPLREVCEFRRGLTYAKGDEVTDSDNVVLRANNIDLTTNQLDLSELRHIRQDIVIPDAKKVRKGSLIVCTASGSKSHLGKVALIDDDYDYAFGGFMGQITPNPELHPKYLFHLMTSGAYKDFIDGLSDGANINNLKFDDLGRFSVPFPDSSGQHRIVSILDEAFAGIATAKANAKKNLENARAIFDSQLQSVFSLGKEAWRAHQLDELTQSDSPITYGVVKPGIEGEIPFVRGGDLVRGKVRVSELRTISRSVSDQYRRTLLQGGELLICLVGQPGQVAVAPKELAGANIARQVGLIRLKPSMNAEFVRYFLQSPPGKEVLGARESGSVQQVINLGDLRHLSVPYPELEEQNEIVKELDAFQADTQRLESLYTRKLAALDELKQSLLHQAFSGQLS